MSELQSYRDFKKDKQMDWADVYFNGIVKMFNHRLNGDNDEFRAAVTAIEIVLHGFIDDEYKDDILLLESRKKHIAEEYSSQQAETYFFDNKARFLSSLIHRINKGTQTKSESADDSRIVREIANNLKKGIGQNVFITGKTGSGKSYTSLQIARLCCEMTGVDFKLGNLVFTQEDFVMVYNDPVLTPPGSFIIYDEAGVTFNARDFQSKGNKTFSKLLQIVRHREILVIFNAPDLSFIDSAGRKLLHWWFETLKIDKDRGICHLKPHVVEVLQNDGKIIFPFPMFDDEKVTRLRVHKLPDKIALAYERKAQSYKDKLAKESEFDIKLAKINSPNSELKEYARLRDSGIIQKEIRLEHMKMSTTKATRLERLYKGLKYAN